MSVYLSLVVDLKWSNVCSIFEAFTDEEFLKLPLHCLEAESVGWLRLPASQHQVIQPSRALGRLWHTVARLDSFECFLVSHVVVGASPSRNDLVYHDAKRPHIGLNGVLVSGEDLRGSPPDWHRCSRRELVGSCSTSFAKIPYLTHLALPHDHAGGGQVTVDVLLSLEVRHATRYLHRQTDQV